MQEFPKILRHTSQPEKLRNVVQTLTNLNKTPKASAIELTVNLHETTNNLRRNQQFPLTSEGAIPDQRRTLQRIHTLRFKYRFMDRKEAYSQ